MPGYVGLSGVCQPCINNCQTCSGSQSTCKTCLNSTYLVTANSSCASSCDPGLFIDSFAQTCVSCTSPCKTCKSAADYCLSCISDFYLQNNTCNNSCPPKYFHNIDRCAPCPENCTVCTSLISCSSCVGKFVLYN
jgi:hypothetical protein